VPAILLAAAAGAGAWWSSVSFRFSILGHGEVERINVQLEPQVQAELEPLQSQPDMLMVWWG